MGMKLTLIDIAALLTVGQIVFGGLFVSEPTVKMCPDGVRAVDCATHMEPPDSNVPSTASSKNATP